MITKVSDWLEFLGSLNIHPIRGKYAAGWVWTETHRPDHNGARWSELTLTPGSHLGPFNDVQIYQPCLRDLASGSWGRRHGLSLASGHNEKSFSRLVYWNGGDRLRWKWTCGQDTVMYFFQICLDLGCVFANTELYEDIEDCLVSTHISLSSKKRTPTCRETYLA